MTAGHLFVVHGKIEHLVHDAAVVPVDHSLAFNPIWHELLGGDRPARPATWAEGWGRIDGRTQWLVEVDDGHYERVLERLTTVLDEIRDAGVTPLGGREVPLVAVPVLGIGRGGHAHEPGRVLKDLVAHLTRRTRELDLDVALVTPEPSVYAAAQFARSALATALPAEVEETAQTLGERARTGELALFLGAGVSIPAGLMSWGDLIANLSQDVASISKDDLDSLSVSATDQAALIELADRNGFQGRVAELAGRAERPSLVHGLLAGLDARQVVTTNYDCLYEKAVGASGRGIASVMPWSAAHGAERWVLKLHGDVEHPNTIVLTRRHMVRYDAANRPSAALLQSIFLTKHLLVVGASLTDDNVVRLAHEVQAYRDDHQEPDTHQAFGTVLDASPHGDLVRARLWDKQLAWLHLGRGSDSPPTRVLELLLDRVGYHAAQKSSWLLDQRFDGLLDTDSDRSLAERTRALYRDLADRDDGPWRPLRAGLEGLGVRGGKGW